VLIVGTHVDHSALRRTSLEQIWQQLRQMLSEARDRHQRYFTHAERLHDCLLCQTDRRRPAGDLADDDATEERHSSGAWFVNHACDAAEHGETTPAVDVVDAVTPSDDDDDETLWSNGPTDHVDDDRRTLMFPHVVGYYEVSCTARGHGIAHLRDAVTELATKLIGRNPDIPRRWSNVERSLAARAERSGSVCTLDELKDIASVQGVSDAHEVMNMIHFFRAQGRLLYFPQVSALSSSSLPRVYVK